MPPPATVPAQTEVRRESLTEQITRVVRREILAGRLPLGSKLREAELASLYNVSHSVIREALHVLQGEGLVVTRPYCGRSVFDVDEQQATELMGIRASLESLAACLAAEKLDTEGAALIRAAAARMKSARPMDRSAWIDAELSFHRTLWKAAKNELLERQLNLAAVPTFALATLRRFRLDFDVENPRTVTAKWEETGDVRGHQALAKAILAKDGGEARKLMIGHILGAPSLRELRQKLFLF